MMMQLQQLMASQDESMDPELNMDYLRGRSFALGVGCDTEYTENCLVGGETPRTDISPGPGNSDFSDEETVGAIISSTQTSRFVTYRLADVPGPGSPPQLPETPGPQPMIPKRRPWQLSG